MRFWFAAYPDIPRPIGGIKQIHRLAEAFQELGCKSFVIQDDSQFHPGWFKSRVNTISLNKFRKIQPSLGSSDFLVIPETYVPVIDSYFPGVRKIIFNQNSSYTFGLNPTPSTVNPIHIKDLYFHPDVSHVLCVSEYDYSFLSTCLGLPEESLTLVCNSVDFEEANPNSQKTPRVCFMPRKNGLHASLVVKLLESMDFSLPWVFTPLSNLSHADVLKYMSISSAFLSFGHPEGFGLPVAEALASGCYVIGYTGLAGREFLNLDSCAAVFSSVEYGDISSFIEAFRSFDLTFSSNPQSLLRELSIASVAIRTKYNFLNMIRSVDSLPAKLASD